MNQPLEIPILGIDNEIPAFVWVVSCQTDNDVAIWRDAGNWWLSVFESRINAQKYAGALGAQQGKPFGVGVASFDEACRIAQRCKSKVVGVAVRDSWPEPRVVYVR